MNKINFQIEELIDDQKYLAYELNNEEIVDEDVTEKLSKTSISRNYSQIILTNMRKNVDHGKVFLDEENKECTIIAYKQGNFEIFIIYDYLEIGKRNILICGIFIDDKNFLFCGSINYHPFMITYEFTYLNSDGSFSYDTDGLKGEMTPDKIFDFTWKLTREFAKDNMH